MLCKNIVIEGENSARFSALLASLRAELNPRNSIEDGMVEDLAASRWRQRRLLTTETACYCDEIRRQDPETAAACPAVRAAQALSTISVSSRTLELINRFELRFERQYNRTLNRLFQLRGARKMDFDEMNPGNS